MGVTAALALAASFGTTVTVTPAAELDNGPAAAAAFAPYRATVIVNGARPGPAFQGIGAISGGGGKRLWEAELGATPSTGTNPMLPGPGGLARALNAAYEQSGITGILVWPLIDAIPPGLPHENRGLVWADRPWDGSYYVTPLTWVIAQTTQFTAPGWSYLAGANGRLPAGGSYDTFLAPGRSAWSMVAQTSTASAPQQVVIRITGGLPGAALIARFQGFRRAVVSQFRGYELKVRGNGAWQIVANGPAAVTLASGSVAPAPIYTLSLTTRGTTISAQVNGVHVATVSSRAYQYGPAGLASLGYYPVRYLSFTVRAGLALAALVQVQGLAYAGRLLLADAELGVPAGRTPHRARLVIAAQLSQRHRPEGARDHFRLEPAVAQHA